MNLVCYFFISVHDMLHVSIQDGSQVRRHALFPMLAMTAIYLPLIMEWENRIGGVVVRVKTNQHALRRTHTMKCKRQKYREFIR